MPPMLSSGDCALAHESPDLKMRHRLTKSSCRSSDTPAEAHAKMEPVLPFLHNLDLVIDVDAMHELTVTIRYNATNLRKVSKQNAEVCNTRGGYLKQSLLLLPIRPKCFRLRTWHRSTGLYRAGALLYAGFGSVLGF